MTESSASPATRDEVLKLAESIHNAPARGGVVRIPVENWLAIYNALASAPSETAPKPARIADHTTHGVLDAAINLLDAHGDSKGAEMIRRDKRIIPNVPIVPPMSALDALMIASAPSATPFIQKLRKWADDWSKETGGMNEGDKGWMHAAREVKTMLDGCNAPAIVTHDPKVHVQAEQVLAEIALRDWLEAIAKLPVLPPTGDEGFRAGWKAGRGT